MGSTIISQKDSPSSEPNAFQWRSTASRDWKRESSQSEGSDCLIACSLLTAFASFASLEREDWRVRTEGWMKEAGGGKVREAALSPART